MEGVIGLIRLQSTARSALSCGNATAASLHHDGVIARVAYHAIIAWLSGGGRDGSAPVVIEQRSHGVIMWPNSHVYFTEANSQLSHTTYVWRSGTGEAGRHVFRQPPPATDEAGDRSSDTDVLTIAVIVCGLPDALSILVESVIAAAFFGLLKYDADTAAVPIDALPGKDSR